MELKGKVSIVRQGSNGFTCSLMKGGLHYETPDGKVVMNSGSNTKSVKEPPHWMLLTPLDSATSGIPTRPNSGGSYIMFAGTPYAHLMIYQDPNMLKQ
jgi:hypothetical protein